MEELCEKVPEAGEFALRCKFLHPPPAAETNASKDPPSKKRKLDPKEPALAVRMHTLLSSLVVNTSTFSSHTTKLTRVSTPDSYWSNR
jgi:hypothetical protein